MPGMMDTVLNIGLSDESVQGLAKQAGNERFAWDAYRRLVQMFGKTVLDIDGDHFEHAIDDIKKAKSVRNDLDLDAADLQNLVETFKGIVKTQTGRDFPQEPREQMDMAIKAVFNSWNSDRAILYRRQERIPTDLGTAVNVVAMVFGNLGMDSGTGVAFTRDPGTGAQGVYGDYLQNAQGEDVVAGIRNTVPLGDLENIDKACYDQLMQIMSTLENHYRDLCDIEFTIERGKLWMLQTRVGKRTAAAAFRIDVPQVRHQRQGHQDRQGHQRVARRGRRQGRLRLAHRGRACRQRREGHPGPPRDQPRRPARHDRRPGHLDQSWRQDQPRGRGRPRHG
jgi:pyruvate,orthophosphate dikinase